MAPARGALPPRGSAQPTGEIWGRGGGSRGSQGCLWWGHVRVPGWALPCGDVTAFWLGLCASTLFLPRAKSAAPGAAVLLGGKGVEAASPATCFTLRNGHSAGTSSMNVAALGHLGNLFPDTWRALGGSSHRRGNPERGRLTPTNPARLSSPLCFQWPKSPSPPGTCPSRSRGGGSSPGTDPRDQHNLLLASSFPPHYP